MQRYEKLDVLLIIHAHTSIEAVATRLHALKLRLRLADAELELLDDVGDFLKAVRVVVLGLQCVADDQKRGALKQDHFVCITDLSVRARVCRQTVHMGELRLLAELQGSSASVNAW